MLKIKSEPVLLWSILGLIFNTAQLAVLPVAPWIHLIIIVVAQLGAAWVARHKVTPVKT